MKLTEQIYFYEGDYTSRTRYVYKGIGSSNFLVIKGRDQVMVDSGTNEGPHKKRIEAEMKGEGIDLHKTSRVLLSHTHPDHVMRAKSISREQPISFIVHRDSEPMARRSSFQFEAHYNYPEFILREIFDIPLWLARYVVKGIFDFDYLKIQHRVADYDSIDLGIQAEIIPLPSHFPGHIGVYFKNEKIFYSADLFDFRVADGGIINNAMASFEQVFRDIEAVRSLDIETMIPGHGRAVRGRSMVNVMLDRVYSGTEGYVKSIRRALAEKKQGRPLKEIVPHVFSDSGAYNLTARKIIIYNTLMYMREMGQAEFTIRDGTAYWRA